MDHHSTPALYTLHSFIHSYTYTRTYYTQKKQVQYIAGGATQNAIRVAQWMLQVRPLA